MPAVLIFDIGKAITEYKKFQDATKYTPDNKIECFKKLIEIQEKIKLTNDVSFVNEYKKEYELCENTIKY
jgi:hypothetical protein